MNWREIITFEPGKRDGKPWRITVQDVMSSLAAGMIRAEILEDFPYLTEDDLNACFAYRSEMLSA